MKAKRVGSWGDIDQKTFSDFAEKVEKLREEMIPRDGDGDSPIRIIIVNRMTHRLSAEPVPTNQVYSYITHNYLEVHPDKQQEMDDETEKWLLFNLHVAQEALDSHFRAKHFEHYEKREHDRKKKLSYPERIKASCHLCSEGVPLKSLGDDDFFVKKYGADYPPRYHEGKGFQPCDSFDVRVEQFRKKKNLPLPQEPTPRYCSNPQCRAKLRDTDSRKGANDKNICVNSRCRKVNEEVTEDAGTVKAEG